MTSHSRLNGFFVFILSLTFVSTWTAQAATTPDHGVSSSVIDHVPGRLLAQKCANANSQLMNESLATNGASIEGEIPVIHVLKLKVPEAALDRVRQALEKSGHFNFVEPDFIAHTTGIPNDPKYTSQWHLPKISAPAAWDKTTGSTGVTVAVIDTGADWTHPDLAARLVPGWNFVTNTSNTQDNGAPGGYGHGTAVAGVIGAIGNNGIGVAGITWKNPIMPLVTSDPTCECSSYSNLASAIIYAADHGARIINHSGAGTAASATLQSAVDHAWSKEAVVFASSGNCCNSSTQTPTTPGCSTPAYPAACNHAVGVTATSSDDSMAIFSDYGSWVILAAPGNSVYTLATVAKGSYASWWGTSFSCPVAAGVGALALSANPSLTAQQLVDILKNNSDDLGAPGFDQYYGYGRVNANKAVSAALGISVSAPVISSSSTTTGTVGTTFSYQIVASNSPTSYGTTGLPAGLNVNTTTGLISGTPTVSGTFVLTLSATNTGGTGTKALTLTVNIADTTAPTVSMTAPLSGASVSGTSVVISANASDNVGVTKVEFYRDGVLISTDTTSPYSVTWNSTTVANGSHTLSAKAYDAAGNVGTSTGVTVTVNNVAADTTAPTASITSPVNGATVSTRSSVTINATAADNAGVSRVEFYVNGSLISTDTAAPYSASWSVPGARNKSYQIQAKAYNAAGNVGSSTIVTIKSQ